MLWIGIASATWNWDGSWMEPRTDACSASNCAWTASEHRLKDVAATPLNHAWTMSEWWLRCALNGTWMAPETTHLTGVRWPLNDIWTAIRRLVTTPSILFFYYFFKIVFGENGIGTLGSDTKLLNFNIFH